MSRGSLLIKEQKAYFKSLLTKELNELLREGKRSSGGKINLKEEIPDLIDQASSETDSTLALRIRERDSRLIGKIKDALARLQDGSFGICEECGMRISEERLKARPVATLCIRCKEKQEHDERLRGL